jgi:hypothetical protein
MPDEWSAEMATHHGSFQHADDVEAFVYYGSFGLLDPKMPIEAFAIRRTLGMTGVRGLLAGAGISSGGGIAAAAVVGWLLDPAHKREGGLDDFIASNPGRPPKVHRGWELGNF